MTANEMNAEEEREYFSRLVAEHDRPKRRPLSLRYPFLMPVIRLIRITERTFANRGRRIARRRSASALPVIVARHQSVLRRRLGDSDPTLQERKVTNLKRASEKLDGLIIEPGETFSLWESVGNPTRRRGYVDGMLLSNGRITEGLGGGLCQMSNFLCWLLLHADTEIVERRHHSKDVFPDSGRTLPFGSGATCLYNYVDLQIKNSGNSPLQVDIRLTDSHLKGCLRSTETPKCRYSLVEKEHAFIKSGGRHFRHNEIWRETKMDGITVKEEKLFTNFAPVLYDVPDSYFTELGYHLVDLDASS